MRTNSIVVGTGGMAQWHIRTMLSMKRSTELVGFVEPSQKSQEMTQNLLFELKVPCPPFYNTISELIDAQGSADAAFICSPHKFHYENTRDCLKAGMDVLLEKPMVMNSTEARSLMRLRDTTGRLLVVAFPGSLSPAISKAKEIISRGTIGNITGISAFAHQNWKNLTTDTWRQRPDISGGGFLFDTGSHMINTVVDLLGEDILKVTAVLNNSGTPVEINASVSAESESGIMISLAGAGDSVQCCSEITVFGDKGILRTGMYGERLLVKTIKNGQLKEVPHRKSKGPWETFLKVRSGKIENPCPPEVGLRFAQLMDMIYKSNDTGKTITRRRNYK